MGVDYDGIGGIGLKITSDIICDLIENGTFVEEDWEDDPEDCLDNIGLIYEQAGSSYSGETYYYWFVEGKNLDEVNSNSSDFIETLNEIGIKITTNDLAVINDLHIW